MLCLFYRYWSNSYIQHNFFFIHFQNSKIVQFRSGHLTQNACHKNVMKPGDKEAPDSLQDETDYLNNVFSKNNYNTDFVRRNTHSNTDSNTQTNSGPVTTATIPYIRGTSETIARILQPYNIRVAHKPITTLRRLLTNVKDKDKPEDRQGALYKIKCCDCQVSYIGETGRNLSTRLIEHKRATRNGDVNNFWFYFFSTTDIYWEQ